MVTSMLEKAIEIEGLLRIIRDGNPLPETYILLNLKAAELAEQAESLEEKASAADPEKATTADAPGKGVNETAVADFVMEAPETQTTPIPEVVFTIEQPEESEVSLARTIESLSDLGQEDISMPSEDLSLIEEDDILLSFEETTDFPLNPAPIETSATETQESIRDEEPTQQQEHALQPEEEQISMGAEPSTPETTEKKEEEADTINSSLEAESVNSTLEAETAAPIEGNEESDTIQESQDSKPEEADKAESTQPTSPKRQVKLRSSFSLNDRYLYARELFNGNMKMFDSTLDYLEGIEDFSIIEDYFYNEMEWNPEDSNVAAFMNILSKSF